MPWIYEAPRTDVGSSFWRFGSAATGSGVYTVPPTWAEEFNAPLDMTTAGYSGRWRANDTWQNPEQGYTDFGASSTWNLNPAQVLDGAARSPFTVSGSVLTITNRPKPEAWAADIATAGGGSTTRVGGILITNTARETERFGYGYYAARMRLPNRGPGMFPAFWLFAANGQNASKELAEIDVFEVFGHSAGQLWNITLHQKKQDGTPAVGATTGNGVVDVGESSATTSGWHVYALDWTATYLRFYRDNVLIANVTGADATFFNGASMSLRLNYAADAPWFPAERKTGASTPDPLIMQVDWVRRWDSKP